MLRVRAVLIGINQSMCCDVWQYSCGTWNRSFSWDDILSALLYVPHVCPYI